MKFTERTTERNICMIRVQSVVLGHGDTVHGDISRKTI